jgi:hypothetical protein
MNKIIYTLSFLIVLSLSGTSFPQNLTQSGFQVVTISKIIGSGSTTRLPCVFRGTVQGLNSYALYRYYIQAAHFTDLGTTNIGAGNSLFMNPDSSKFIYTTGPSLNTSGNYSVFRTDATGSYTGWFSFVNTGNARFTPGYYLTPSIAIGDSLGALVSRCALNDSILVVGFNTVTADTCGTGIWGKSRGVPMNIVLLYDNVTGSGKPLNISYLESEGTTISNEVQFYVDSVNGKSNRWGTIIPNNNSSGVRRIEQASLSTGLLIGYNTCSTGLWPNGTNTVNPTGGTSAIIIDSLEAPLPVELSTFTVRLNGNSVNLNWKTESELNNYGFEIERKSDVSGWVKVGFIQGNGTSTIENIYSFIDSKISNTGVYSYRLKQIDNNGLFKYSNIISVNYSSPDNFSLSQNYPNPFNPNSIITYSLPQALQVKLLVYNSLGQIVKILEDDYKEAGVYNITFNASGLPSGIYFYKIEAGQFSKIRKMILVK